jgi:SLT domain-containing protein
MKATNTPISWLPGLMTIAQHESGGNPNSINLWDSNAKAGHPSQGLMSMSHTFNPGDIADRAVSAFNIADSGSGVVNWISDIIHARRFVIFKGAWNRLHKPL